MAEAGIIQPSSRLRAAAAVLLKKDSTYCFCVDYHLTCKDWVNNALDYIYSCTGYWQEELTILQDRLLSRPGVVAI